MGNPRCDVVLDAFQFRSTATRRLIRVLCVAQNWEFEAPHQQWSPACVAQVITAQPVSSSQIYNIIISHSTNRLSV